MEEGERAGFFKEYKIIIVTITRIFIKITIEEACRRAITI